MCRDEDLPNFVNLPRKYGTHIVHYVVLVKMTISFVCVISGGTFLPRRPTTSCRSMASMSLLCGALNGHIFFVPHCRKYLSFILINILVFLYSQFFQDAVTLLPPTCRNEDLPHYVNLLRKYGTHVVRYVVLGKMAVRHVTLPTEDVMRKRMQGQSLQVRPGFKRNLTKSEMELEGYSKNGFSCSR